MKLLSLDISSTTIGWALYHIENKKIKLIKYDRIIPPKKEKNFLLKLHQTKKDFVSLLQTIQPDKVVIEEITKFMPGKSSANTIITLAVYNRTLALTCLEQIGLLPDFMSVLAIRHKLKLDKKLPEKESIPSLLEKHLKIKFNWIKKKNGKIADASYDQADACAVGLAYYKKYLE